MDSIHPDLLLGIALTPLVGTGAIPLLLLLLLLLVFPSLIELKVLSIPLTREGSLPGGGDSDAERPACCCCCIGCCFQFQRFCCLCGPKTMAMIHGQSGRCVSCVHYIPCLFMFGLVWLFCACACACACGKWEMGSVMRGCTCGESSEGSGDGNG